MPYRSSPCVSWLQAGGLLRGRICTAGLWRWIYTFGLTKSQLSLSSRMTLHMRLGFLQYGCTKQVLES